MKILHITTRDAGGAGKACLRLNKALNQQDIESSVLVLKKVYNSNAIQLGENSIGKWQVFGNKVKKEIYKRFFSWKISGRDSPLEMFSSPLSLFDITKSPYFRKADIINLHWTSEFLNYSSFFKKCKKPIVWTIHDMEPYTGGCHYSFGCDHFTQNCIPCPQLEGSKYLDLALKNQQLKKEALKQTQNLKIVGPSNWIITKSQSSALFKNFEHFVINNSIDINVFNTYDRVLARKEFGLPLNKKVILFVADSVNNPRKGFSFIIKALKQMKGENLNFCSVGSIKKEVYDGVPVKSFGNILSEEKLAKIYAASDLFIIPSLEDNLPNTILEAQACGVPVLGFPRGGIPELIEQGKTGLVTKDATTDSLIHGIKEVISNLSNYNFEEIRKVAEMKFDPKVQAKRYLDVYNKILN